MRKKLIWKSVLVFLFVFFLSLSFFSSRWATGRFAFLSFDETLFQLTTPIKSAETSILYSFFFDSFLKSLFVSFLLSFFILFAYRFLLKKGKSHSILIKRCFLIVFIVLFFVDIYYCLNKITFLSFVKNQLHTSSFIEENYVDPRNVKVEFPDVKRNLIYIYVESLESSYFSKELGGSSSHNLLEPLTSITRENISFSDTSKFGGAKSVPGTTWTSSAMIAQTSGVPLKSNLKKYPFYSSMVDGAYSLGNILEKNGYHQMIMMGSDASFGSRDKYFKEHGHYEVYDYYTAIKKRKIEKDYYEWWGFEDSKLFEFAKEELLTLEEPFNFTLLTANTHTLDGYVEKDCPSKFSRSYENAIYCSSLQIQDFVEWVKKQDFYSNTTIIIVGDHISMQPNFLDSNNRRVYNVFINSSVMEGDFKNREFSTMDFFPTTLASLGATIEGEQLGLGVNLFSEKKTLMEEVGYSSFQKELSYYSPYYVEKILSKK